MTDAKLDENASISFAGQCLTLWELAIVLGAFFLDGELAVSNG